MAAPQLTPSMEAALMAFAQQQSGIGSMLRNFFAFLHSRTDFYMVDPSPHRPAGFAPGEAEALLLKAFHSLPYRDAAGRVMAAPAAAAAAPTSAAAGSSTPPGSSKGAPAAKKTEAEKKAQEPTAKDAPEAPAPVPVAKEQPAAAAASSSSPSLPPSPASQPAPYSFPEATGPLLQIDEEGRQIPVGNGGTGPGFWWTQTPDEVSVWLALMTAPPSVKGRDLRVSVEKGVLSVTLASHSPPRVLCSAKLAGEVPRDGLVWGVETGAEAQASIRSRPLDPSQPWITPPGLTAPPPVLTLTLQKTAAGAGGYWARPFTRLTQRGQLSGCVEGAEADAAAAIAGDFDDELLPCIVLTGVDTTRSILEYDEDTQAAIRRAVYDGRASAAGLPTSAEVLAAQAGAASTSASGGSGSHTESLPPELIPPSSHP